MTLWGVIAFTILNPNLFHNMKGIHGAALGLASSVQFISLLLSVWRDSFIITELDNITDVR